MVQDDLDAGLPINPSRTGEQCHGSLSLKSALSLAFLMSEFTPCYKLEFTGVFHCGSGTMEVVGEDQMWILSTAALQGFLCRQRLFQGNGR
jgi:ABC-type multidrug transport system permease subunit